MSVRHASKSVVDALPLSRSSIYVCRQCRRNAHPSQILIQQRQYASERTDGLPLAERVRRKLWKGKPPGPENVDDLYGGPGALETMFKERKERRSRSRAPPKDESVESQASVEASPSDARTTTPEFQPLPRPEQSERALARSKRARQIEDSVTTEAEPQFGLSDPDLKQATTWDGLAIIGHQGNWKEMPVRNEDEYTPWLPLQLRKEWSYSELVCLMHQALLECHNCQKWQVPPDYLVSRANSKSPLNSREMPNATFQLSARGTIESVEGLARITKIFRASSYIGFREPKAELKPYSPELEAAIIARTEPELTPFQPRHIYTPNDTTFLDATIDVTDPLTIHILRRFSRLINHTVPDPLLTDLFSTDLTKNTIRTFLTAMAEKTKKKDPKVAELLMNDQTLVAQSNLLVLGRRETPVDKEKETGRWKVIEEELKARGLPVLGRVEIQK